MDKFSQVITTNISRLKAVTPLPNKPRYSVFDISFDKFAEFINWYSKSHINLPLLSATIYDEDIILSPEQFNLRYQFLRLINSLNFKNISFILSDSTMPIYNEIMKKIGWKHVNKTTLHMSINRHPQVRTNLQLAEAQGQVKIKEENLIWCSPIALAELKGKNIIDARVLEDAIRLKEIVFNYYTRLNSLYHTEYFTDFDKVLLTYDFIKRHISFAGEATRTLNGKQILYNPNNIYDWVSQPLGTYQHKRGVCEGQARLMQALINNPYFRSDAVTIDGTCPLGNHAWVGTVINNHLYQTCLTMAGPFKDLEARGYVPDSNQIYPRLYESSSLSTTELLQIQSHIKRLKK